MIRSTLPLFAFFSAGLLVPAAPAQVGAVHVIDNEAPDFPDFADRFDRLGGAVTVVGDLDGDGIDELVAGAWGGDMVQVFFLNADGTVRANQRIGISQGGLVGDIDNWFGHAVEALGDLDGDGVPDLAVGERLFGNNQGAVWILFLNPDGTVKAEQRITQGEGGFSGTLGQNERLGSSIANIGDLDGDGVIDLAVGAEGKNGFRGALWILYLNPDGTVKADLEITEGQAGFNGPLEPEDYFGSGVAATPDLDGDGVVDLAVGAIFDDDAGAFWLLALNPDGTVKNETKFFSPGNFGDTYGGALAFLGDLGGDGTVELAVGAQGDDGGGPGQGAVFVYSLNALGQIVGTQKISGVSGGFGGQLTGADAFGSGLAPLGDFDGDGIADLAIGAENDKDGSPFFYSRGAVWLVYLNADGTVKQEVKISAESGGIPSTLEEDDEFGYSAAPLGDVDGDGTVDLAVGAHFGELSPGSRRGAAWVLFLNPDGTVREHVGIAAGLNGFAGPLADFDFFGTSVAGPGDIDGDGVPDLAVGARGDDEGGSWSGAVWVLFLNPDGTVKGQQKLGGLTGGFSGTVPSLQFGTALAAVGDLDGDGRGELAASGVASSGSTGRVWVLFLNADGTVANEVELSAGLGSALELGDSFGHSLAPLGDQDGDGQPELAVGAVGDDDGANAAGAVWILSLTAAGTSAAETKISALHGNLVYPVEAFDRLGDALAAADLDGDGVRDLLLGRPTVAGGGLSSGSVLQLFLNADGSVRSHRELDPATGVFIEVPSAFDRFGESVASLGDLDGDGRADFTVGLPGEDHGGIDHGAVWIAFGDGSAPDWAYRPYGACVNPPASLTVLGGLPTVGSVVTLGVDNPLGTQSPGAASLVFLATAPDPAFPCGTPLPGLGMAGPGAPGGLLLSIVPPDPFQPALLGDAWAGAGSPAAVALAIPSNASLAGVSVFAQGALIDPGAALGVAVGLTSGVEIQIGM